MEFWGAEGQLEALEDNQITEGMLFEKPTMEMTKHLKPLYIKAYINGKPFNWVFLDGRVMLNIMPLVTMVRIIRNYEDLIPTNMKRTDFMGLDSHTTRVRISDMTIGSKVARSAFFVIEVKPSVQSKLH